MLVVRRKAGESIVIGGDIEIEVMEVSGARVKLGIRAPRETLILRKELLATGEENQRAALSLGHGGLAALLECFAHRPAHKPFFPVLDPKLRKSRSGAWCDAQLVVNPNSPKN